MDLNSVLMLLITIMFALLVYLGINTLLQHRKEQHDDIKRRMDEVSKLYRREIMLNEELSKPISERLFKPLLQGTLSGMKKFLPDKSNAPKGKQSDKLKAKLRSAGISMDPGEYQFLMLLVVGGCALLFGILGFAIVLTPQAALMGMVLGLYAGYAVMRFRLVAMISARKESMQKQLPEVLDMLSVSVEAGLGLEQAMQHVISHFKGALIDEMSVTVREMGMGRSRRDALLALGERCELEEVKSFARAIVQAAQMGISIRNVLRSQSELMRQTRRNKIEEKAMQISVKILIPMVVFIFPVIFIVLLGPAAVNIYETFY